MSLRELFITGMLSMRPRIEEIRADLKNATSADWALLVEYRRLELLYGDPIVLAQLAYRGPLITNEIGRHPRLKAEDLPTTRGDVIAFSNFLCTHPEFCLAVMKTVETARHNEAIVAEHKRREAWPRWRKTVHKLWLRVR